MLRKRSVGDGWIEYGYGELAIGQKIICIFFCAEKLCSAFDIKTNLLVVSDSARLDTLILRSYGLNLATSAGKEQVVTVKTRDSGQQVTIIYTADL